MSHYQERLDQDLTSLREQVGRVGRAVQGAVRDSVHALLTGDGRLATKVVLGDLPINRTIRGIDRQCHAFVARHLPAAGPLRFVSSVLRLDVALERIGDYAVTIAKEALDLSAPPPAIAARDIEMLAEQAQRILGQSLRAFGEANAEQAEATKGMAAQVESTFYKVFSDLVGEAERDSRPVKDLFALLVIINRISRVSDQAKNICEETVFSATGQGKEPKRYRILFVDETNSSLSLLAEAQAREAFPNSGEFASAGWAPAAAAHPLTVEALGRAGLPERGLGPSPMPELDSELGRYHVIVNLQAGTPPPLAKRPFHTMIVAWDVGPHPDRLDPEAARERIDEALRRITDHTRELMQLLRGEGAD